MTQPNNNNNNMLNNMCDNIITTTNIDKGIHYVDMLIIC